MKKISLISLLLCLCLTLSLVLTACGNSDTKSKAETETTAATEAEKASDGIDYMALVNKTNPLPEKWEEQLETVKMTNSVGDEVEVEKKAYDAYLELKAALEKEDVYVDLDSARRSVADQQRIMDEFTEEYGADYAAKTVAKPGYSEHHTGLALDLYLIIDGKDVVENEDMMQYPEIWEKIHKLLPEYGFILRYLDGKEHITGYGYEPWHIRYLDDKAVAKEITDKGLTFEGYLGTASEDEVEIDLGSSGIYTEQQLKDAVVTIKCEFAFIGNRKLLNIRYAGDEAVGEENTAKFLMDFHTDEQEGTTLNSNQDYLDYGYFLKYSEEDGWEITDKGYGG